MPFPFQLGVPFVRFELEAIIPGQIGVYGLFNANGWVYIGKGDIRERLLCHLRGDNPFLTLMAPTHWVSEVTTFDPSIRERQLILELDPWCNRRVG